MEKAILTRRMKAAAARLGLSANEIARRMSDRDGHRYAVSTVANWLNGRRQPTPESLACFAATLGMAVEDLTGPRPAVSEEVRAELEIALMQLGRRLASGESLADAYQEVTEEPPAPAITALPPSAATTIRAILDRYAGGSFEQASPAVQREAARRLHREVSGE